MAGISDRCHGRCLGFRQGRLCSEEEAKEGVPTGSATASMRRGCAGAGKVLPADSGNQLRPLPAVKPCHSGHVSSVAAKEKKERIARKELRKGKPGYRWVGKNLLQQILRRLTFPNMIAKIRNSRQDIRIYRVFAKDP
jgi:hypothetical protein